MRDQIGGWRESPDNNGIGQEMSREGGQRTQMRVGKEMRQEGGTQRPDERWTSKEMS